MTSPGSLAVKNGSPVAPFNRSRKWIGIRFSPGPLPATLLNTGSRRSVAFAADGMSAAQASRAAETRPRDRCIAFSYDSPSWLNWQNHAFSVLIAQSQRFLQIDAN